MTNSNASNPALDRSTPVDKLELALMVTPGAADTHHQRCVVIGFDGGNAVVKVVSGEADGSIRILDLCADLVRFRQQPEHLIARKAKAEARARERALEDAARRVRIVKRRPKAKPEHRRIERRMKELTLSKRRPGA